MRNEFVACLCCAFLAVAQEGAGNDNIDVVQVSMTQGTVMDQRQQQADVDPSEPEDTPFDEWVKMEHESGHAKTDDLREGEQQEREPQQQHQHHHRQRQHQHQHHQDHHGRRRQQPQQDQEQDNCPEIYYSKSCSLYPNKLVTMVTVGDDLIEFFENWYLFAAPQLECSFMQLVVVAEDSESHATLHRLKESGYHFEILDADTLVDGTDYDKNQRRLEKYKRSHEASRLSQHRVVPLNSHQRHHQRHEQHHDQLHQRHFTNKKKWDFESAVYNSWMAKRPWYVRHFLEADCSLLFSDIDMVWKGDVFAELRQYKEGSGDMHVYEDGPQGMRDLNFCGGFIYFHPTPFTNEVTTEWAHQVDAKNQVILNEVLRDKDYEAHDVHVLDPHKFFGGWEHHPPIEDAVLIHANWLIGTPEKEEFLKANNLWKVGVDSSDP